MAKGYSLMRSILKGLLILLAGLWVPMQGTCSDFPDKPIQLIVPFPPGGITDLNARLISAKCMEYLGQPMIVLNKPGATGSIGMDFVAKAKPDGHILGMGASSTLAILKATNPRLPYDPVKDLTPICRLLVSPGAILVRRDSQLNTLEKLVDYAKKNPGKLNYGTGGVGLTQHFACELFQQESGIQMVHVPYKGAAPSVMALLGGHVDLTYVTISDGMEQIKGGTVIALAVSSAERYSELPNIPSLSEKGYPRAVNVGWIGVVGPARLPEPVLDKLAKYFQKVFASPDMNSKMRGLGNYPAYMGSKEFGEFLRSEINIYVEVAKKAGLRSE
jgi:tripartite-type tricarboxylate transporter receptor subunit TctC